MDGVMKNKSKLSESKQLQLNLEIKKPIEIKNNIVCFNTAKIFKQERNSISPLSRILKSAEKLTW